MTLLLPFGASLGADADLVSSKVRAHFVQPPGVRHYRGSMIKIWRSRGWRGALSAPFLWLSSRADILFTETGTNVRFEITNIVTRQDDGRATMTWTRTFHFASATRVFHAVMVYDPKRKVIDDRLGRAGRLEVELVPHVEDGGVIITSRRQWLRMGFLRVRVPNWLAGQSRIHEWARSDGELGIRVTVTNPILGEVFGYEGHFDRVE